MRLSSLLWLTPMFLSTTLVQQTDQKSKADPFESRYGMMVEQTEANEPDEGSVQVGFYKKEKPVHESNILLKQAVDFTPPRNQIKRVPIYTPTIDVNRYYLGSFYRKISGTLIFGVSEMRLYER